MQGVHDRDREKRPVLERHAIPCIAEWMQACAQERNCDARQNVKRRWRVTNGSVDLRDRIFEIRMPEAGQIALGLIFADLRD